MQKGVKVFIRNLFGVWAGILLLIFIGFISLLGTVPSDFIGRDLYHSPIFIFLLGWLAILTFCVTLRGIFNLSFNKKIKGILTALPTYHLVIDLSLGCVETKQKIFSILKTCRFFICRNSPTPGGTLSFYTVKNRWGMLGPLGMHAGVLILLLAGLITFLLADIREMVIPEGGEIVLPREKLSLRLEKFSILLYPGKEQAQQYISRFLIKDEEGSHRHENLGVNHPLVIGSTKIFQMRYRMEVPRLELLVYKGNQIFTKVLLEKEKWLAVPSTPLTVRYDEIIPDFRIGPSGEIFSAGTTLRNPAVKLFIRDEKSSEAQEQRWIFQDILNLPGHSREKQEWQFVASRFHKVFYSGIRVSNDPGIPFAHLGYIILVGSAFLCSFAIPQWIRITLTDKNEKTEVVLEGICQRDPDGLKDEMTNLASMIQKEEAA